MLKNIALVLLIVALGFVNYNRPKEAEKPEIKTSVEMPAEMPATVSVQPDSIGVTSDQLKKAYGDLIENYEKQLSDYRLLIKTYEARSIKQELLLDNCDQFYKSVKGVLNTM